MCADGSRADAAAFACNRLENGSAWFLGARASCWGARVARAENWYQTRYSHLVNNCNLLARSLRRRARAMFFASGRFWAASRPRTNSRSVEATCAASNHGSICSSGGPFSLGTGFTSKNADAKKTRAAPPRAQNSWSIVDSTGLVTKHDRVRRAGRAEPTPRQQNASSLVTSA